MKPFPLGEKNGYDFVSCRFCGSVMVDPWPTAEEIERYFGDVQPEATHIPNHEKHMEDIEKRLRKLFPAGGAGKTFVDISCQNGYAVTVAKKMGFDARGIDARDFFVRFAQSKFDPSLFQEGTAGDIAASGQKFDIIYCFEHLCQELDLNSFLSSVSKILAPNGLLLIEEPDGNHFNVPKKFTSWPVVFPPLNFVFVSKKGLDRALNRHGLKIKNSAFSWRPFMHLVVGKAE
jgi:SAM-dependent methyltransferase